MNKTPIYLSVIIPQYNELKNLERNVLDDVYNFLVEQPYSWEVIISDDGSTDGSDSFSREYIKKHKGFRFIRNRHGGKALALYRGIKKAKGECLLFMDMDQSTPVDELTKLLPYFPTYDIVIGSRKQSRIRSSLLRKIASKIFSFCRRILLLREIEDTQCGFKVFKRSQIIGLFSKLDAVTSRNVLGWNVSAFDVELLYMAQKRGLEIKEVVVEWRNEDTSDTKQRKFIRESVDMLKQIMKVRLNDFRGKYESKI